MGLLPMETVLRRCFGEIVLLLLGDCFGAFACDLVLGLFAAISGRHKLFLGGQVVDSCEQEQQQAASRSQGKQQEEC